MDAAEDALLSVRDAVEADIPALVALKGAGSEAQHHDRLRETQGTGFRYLVLVLHQDVIGFACLVFRRPANWSDTDSTERLPQIVDLRVAESQQGRGYGTHFIRAIEEITAQAGHKELYISVEPLDNLRAYMLYVRLGYQPLQTEPYLEVWEYTDSAGILHHGEDWVVDMVKQL